MLVLDSTTKSIVATMSGTANTTNPSFVTAYSDNTGTVFTEGSSDGALNGISSVTLVAAPASSTRRLIKTIYISNIDTAAVTVTISYNDNSTLRQIAKVTLQVGDTWSTDGTTDNTGSLKTTAGSVNLSNVTGTLTANGIVYASSTSVLTTGSALTFNGTNFATSNSMRVTGSTTSYASGAGAEITYISGSTKGGIQVYDRTASAYRDVFLDGANALFQISGSEQMRLNSTGLGIGTSSPATKLHVVGTGALARVTNTSATGYATLQTFNDSGINASFGMGGSTASLFANSAFIDVGGVYPIVFAINDVEKMRLDSSGNLGIGTSSPNARLDVRSANKIVDGIGNVFFATTDSQAADLGAILSLGGTYAGTSAYSFAAIAGKKTNSTSTDASGYLAMYTTNPSNTIVERMRLDSSGNLGLGVTPSAFTGLGATVFESNGGATAYRGATSGVEQYTNTYFNGGFLYKASGYATRFTTATGAFTWYNAPSGTAGNAITFTQAMTLDASGNLDLAVGGALFTLNRGSYSQQTKFYQDTGSGAGAQYETTNPTVNALYYAHVFKGTNNVPTTVEYGRFNQFGLGLGGASPSSGTGITFPATQSASSDVNTLDDYEEGTWTPNQGFGLTVVGTFSSTGKYTKIGRVVTVQGSFSATSIAVNGNNVMCSNLPFPNMNVSASNFIGGASNSSLSALINVWVDQPATSMYAVSSMAGTSGIYFTVTYFTTT